jgi:signal transduction histidine kinase
MQDGVLPADEERLGIVREETRRLSRMADGILELTRLERGAVPLRSEPLDLAEVVCAAIDAHGALVEAAGLTLTTDVAERVMVNGDCDRLTQAVGNLLANAVRYTPEGGMVHVALRADQDRAAVEIADTGVGIAPEDLERVFDRFWRASDARDRASGGLGIGLAIVREIVERHGGTVGATARESGGTVFTVRLPLLPRI